MFVRFWADSEPKKDQPGRYPFVLKTFLLAIGYAPAREWTQDIQLNFDLWAIQQAPIRMYDDANENQSAWEKMRIFVGQLDEAGKLSPKTKKSLSRRMEGEPSDSSFPGMLQWAKASGDGCDEGRKHFKFLISNHWYLKCKISPTMTKVTSDEECNPLTDMLSESDALSKALPFSSMLKVEVAHVLAQEFFGQGAFRVGGRVDLRPAMEKGMSVLVTDKFYFGMVRKRYAFMVKKYKSAREALELHMKGKQIPSL